MIFGSVTRTSICQPLAPSVSAASSSELPCACITASTSRATKGKVTNMVAITMPGTAKTIFRSRAASHGPSSPCRPKSSTKTRPAMTGETAKGRSISVTSALFPRNENFAMPHAAAIPKTTLTGTAMAAASSVRRMAASESGARIAARYAPGPPRRAWANTATSGRTTSSPSSAAAAAMSRPRTDEDSVTADERGLARWRVAGMG